MWLCLHGTVSGCGQRREENGSGEKRGREEGKWDGLNVYKAPASVSSHSDKHWETTRMCELEGGSTCARDRGQ